jgi:hypothetical protein
MKLLSALVFALLVFSAVRAYTEVSTIVDVQVQPDGTARVSERYSLFLQSEAEVEEFENLRKFGSNTVVSWRRFLPSMKYHLTGGVTPLDTRVSARRLFDIGARSAAIELDYYVQNPIFNATQTLGRTTTYTLLPDAIAFDRTENRVTNLPPTVTLEFELPENARVEKATLAPPVSSINGNNVMWVGPLAGSWTLSYKLEKQLGVEVSEYFSNAYAQAFQLIPTFLPIALVLLLAAFVYSKTARKQ